MAEREVIVCGAGMGGLVAAALLAARGVRVTVLDVARDAGGKLAPVEVGGQAFDAGPTVFTMRWVFDALFESIGESLESHLTIKPARVLARHAWSRSERLDLFADPECSAQAIAAFAGAAEADGFRRFLARADGVYRTLATTFIEASRPSPISLATRIGLGRLGDLWRISPFVTLWRELGRYFADPRLRQLFGRYATYCGSSPFAAPATLMLVASVEQAGVFLVEGGMGRLARVFEELARRNGARFRYQAAVTSIDAAGGSVSGVTLADGTRLPADAVIFNGDAAALASGLLGSAARGGLQAPRPAARSLSAATWLMQARARGFPLSRHSVFFARDYRAEFDAIMGRGCLPDDPTVYVCAQDRSAADEPPPDGPERLMCLVNAPALGGDGRDWSGEIDRCQDRMLTRLSQCGLDLEPMPGAVLARGPDAFATRYPATQGALYGAASHGWMASFARPGSRSRLKGLYLAGGSIHPGPGVPMAALSGRLAAEALLSDWASTPRFVPAAMSGGTSTASATTARMR